MEDEEDALQLPVSGGDRGDVVTERAVLVAHMKAHGLQAQFLAPGHRSFENIRERLQYRSRIGRELLERGAQDGVAAYPGDALGLPVEEEHLTVAVDAQHGHVDAVEQPFEQLKPAGGSIFGSHGVRPS